MSLIHLAYVAFLPFLPSTGQDDGVAKLVARAKTGDLAAHRALGAAGDPGKKALIALLRDKELRAPARFFAANILGETKYTAALPDLVRHLADDSVEQVRRCCAYALGMLGDERAIPALEKAAKSDPGWYPDGAGGRQYLVRFRAEEALARLRGQPLPKPPRRRAPRKRSAPFKYVPKTDTAFSAKLPWAKTLEEAIARAKKEKKLVLATVVAVQDRRFSGGYEDAAAVRRGLGNHPWGNERASEIDAGLVKERMMLATMFGDEWVARLVAKCFVPVRLRLHTYLFEPKPMGLVDPLVKLGTAARLAQAPAIVYAKPDGEHIHTCSRIGVFSVALLYRMSHDIAKEHLGGDLALSELPFPRDWSELPRDAREPEVLAAIEAGNFKKAELLLRGSLLATKPGLPRHHWLHWFVLERLGKKKEAGDVLARLRQHGSDPWTERTRLRGVPRGGRPLVWESHGLTGPKRPSTTERRVPRAELDTVVRDAVHFLLRQQEADGSWPDPSIDPHPMAGKGSRYDSAVARTALAVDALTKLGSHAKRGRDADRAIERGRAFVDAFAAKPEEFIWQATYALHLQVERLEKKQTPEVTKLAQNLVATLARMQRLGGWSYMPPPRIHSFNTAPVLLLLADLRDCGVEVPAEMMQKAARFLESLRRDGEPREFAYASSFSHKNVGSSSCRTALCELALLRHAKGADVARLRAGVELFFEHEPGVRRTTKVFESYFSPSTMHDAYHYFFGHYYVARALHWLPREEAKRFADKQLDILLGQVELDGSFVDAQMQGKAYSTAMALLTIAELLPLVE